MVKLLFHSEGDLNYFRQHVSFLHSVIFTENFMWSSANSLHPWKFTDNLFSYGTYSLGFKSFMSIRKIYSLKFCFQCCCKWLMQNLCYQWPVLLIKAHPGGEWKPMVERPLCTAGPSLPQGSVTLRKWICKINSVLPLTVT